MTPWNEQMFGAWGLGVVLLPALVALSALLSLFSSLWTRLRWRPRWGGCLISTVAALSLCVWRAGWWGFGYLRANPLMAVGYMLPLVLILVLPQMIAYPMSRERPLKRVWMTALLASAGSVLWVVMAAFSGATTD
jgi:hypothetical protein